MLAEPKTLRAAPEYSGAVHPFGRWPPWRLRRAGKVNSGVPQSLGCFSRRLAEECPIVSCEMSHVSESPAEGLFLDQARSGFRLPQFTMNPMQTERTQKRVRADANHVLKQVFHAPP